MNKFAKSKFKVVQGELPRVIDFQSWDDTKIYKLVKFIDFFTEGEKMNFSYEKRKEMEMIDDPYFEEFMVRIDSPSWTEIRKDKFKMRFLTMMRTFLGFLKRNPHLISEDIYIVLSKSPRMDWAKQAFESKVTKIGAEIVGLHTEETCDTGIKNVSPNQTNPQPAEVYYNQAVLSLASSLKDLVKGINKTEMKNMKVEDKLRIAGNLITVLQKNFQGYKPNVMVFKQLNIHKATREELEQSFTEYNENQ